MTFWLVVVLIASIGAFLGAAVHGNFSGPSLAVAILVGFIVAARVLWDKPEPPSKKKTGWSRDDNRRF